MAYTKGFSGWPNASLILAQVKQEKEGKLGKGKKADQAPCLAVERLETVAQFNERFGQGQTTRQGIGLNQNKSSHSQNGRTNKNVAN